MKTVIMMVAVCLCLTGCQEKKVDINYDTIGDNLHEVQCGYRTYQIFIPPEVQNLEAFSIGYCVSIKSYLSE